MVACAFVVLLGATRRSRVLNDFRTQVGRNSLVLHGEFEAPAVHIAHHARLGQSVVLPFGNLLVAATTTTSQIMRPYHHDEVVLFRSAVDGREGIMRCRRARKITYVG